MSIEIHHSALKAMKEFPSEVLREAKEAFALLEAGEVLSMPLSRPMPSVWPRCFELRFSDRQGKYRIFYFIVVKGTIYVPHCFQKKSQKTPQTAIELVQRRIKEFLNEK